MDKNVDKFLKYMSKPLTKKNLDLVYTSNNIVFERAELYRDFILTLNDLILTTYLGDAFTNAKERVNHFNWCWNSTAEALNHPQINFTDNVDCKKYFINFYFDVFYDMDKIAEEDNINKINLVWETIFNYNIEKPRTDLDTFLTLYRVFEKSYKKV